MLKEKKTGKSIARRCQVLKELQEVPVHPWRPGGGLGAGKNDSTEAICEQGALTVGDCTLEVGLCSDR